MKKYIFIMVLFTASTAYAGSYDFDSYRARQAAEEQARQSREIREQQEQILRNQRQQEYDQRRRDNDEQFRRSMERLDDNRHNHHRLEF